MTRVLQALVLATAVATTATIALAADATKADAPGAAITVTASNFTFETGSKIIAHVGKPTTLELTSKEGVHGIKSDELGIPDTMLTSGKTVKVTFTPKKAGEYTIHCSVPCGTGHADMQFTVKVEDS
jgi:cytochrome c oxidase subunit 2